MCQYFSQAPFIESPVDFSRRKLSIVGNIFSVKFCFFVGFHYSFELFNKQIVFIFGESL